MVKKEKMKKLLEINPLSFYMTNWGFVNNTAPKERAKPANLLPKIKRSCLNNSIKIY
jgi:hypothetical protein